MNIKESVRNTRQLAFNRDLAKFTDRQQEAVHQLKSGQTKFLLYGGALGGGKSYFLRWMCVRRLLEFAQQGFEGVPAMLACEDYPSLKDRQLQKISKEFPPWLGKMHQDHKTYGKSFILEPEYGRGVICFRNLDDSSKYQSAEFALIAVDELTKDTYETFVFLYSRLRWPGLDDNQTWFIAGTNPGGIGHGWVKQFWIDREFPEEWRTPVDFSQQFAFVPSKADDNPHLPPSYWAHLQTLPPNLREAFRDGSWNVFIGQAFSEFMRMHHVVEDNPPVPENAPLYMTFDWGFGKPFSIGWWWVDNDGRIFRFAEWYGWTGVPDQGLRLPDSEIVEGIVKREEQLGIADKAIVRLTGHDCFNRRPDHKGGGQGPSTSEVFQQQGLILQKADSTRDLKIRAFRERLKVPVNDRPMLQVYAACKQFIRTIPTLIMDEHNPEDLDTDGEDHIYDEACQICMARPILPERPPRQPTMAERDFAHIEGRGDPAMEYGQEAVNIDDLEK